jgi:hypothetical protein
MGDFERIFGAGKSVESMIDGINQEYFHEALINNSKRTFKSYKEASEWARKNPGKVIIKSQWGEGYEEKWPSSSE